MLRVPLKNMFWLLIMVMAPVVGGQTEADAPRLEKAVKLVIVSPLDFQVFQRQSSTNGTIPVEVFFDVPGREPLTNCDKLAVRLITRSGPSESTNNWQLLPFDNRVRRSRGSLQAPAGAWHRLEIRLGGPTNIVAQATVEHVGVGEIFIVGGQSNSANHGEQRQRPRSPLVVAYGNGRWQPANDPQPDASGKGGSFLPAFGDALTGRLKVPIGFVSIGVGATSVREWLPKGDSMAAPPTTGANTVVLESNLLASTGELFERIVEAERLLGSNGFRAFLWHQGESDAHQAPDRSISPEQYRKYLKRVIESSRIAAGWRVPWFVAQVSYRDPVVGDSPELRAAQEALVTDGVALAGPNTDELGPEFREKGGHGIHFNAQGLRKHGELWAKKVGPWCEQH